MPFFITPLEKDLVFLEALNIVKGEEFTELKNYTVYGDGKIWEDKNKTNKDVMDSLWRITTCVHAHRLQVCLNPNCIIKLAYDYNAVKEKD